MAEHFRIASSHFALRFHLPPMTAYLEPPGKAWDWHEHKGTQFEAPGSKGQTTSAASTYPA